MWISVVVRQSDGFGLCEVGDFFTTKLIRSTNLQVYEKLVIRSTAPPLLQNPCYALAFLSSVCLATYQY